MSALKELMLKVSACDLTRNDVCLERAYVSRVDNDY